MMIDMVCILEAVTTTPLATVAALGIGGTIAAGTALAGTAATIYGATQSPDAPAPIPMNPGRQLQKYVEGLGEALPDLASLEGRYRPDFGRMNLADMQQFLMGDGNMMGLIGLGGSATASAQEQINAARADDLASILGSTELANMIVGAVSPRSQQLAQRQTDLANERYQAANRLTGQEQRRADQTARESFAARGRVNDNASVAAEILNREEFLANKRAEAAQFGAQAQAMDLAATNPAYQFLGQVPASTALGQDYAMRGMSIIGQNVPQLIDTGAAMNLGAQNTANLNSYMQANAASRQAQNAMIGDMGTSLLGFAGDYFNNRSNGQNR